MKPCTKCGETKKCNPRQSMCVGCEAEYNRNKKLKARYGISAADYDSMYEKQGGRCQICDAHQSELKRSLAVDHCHTTGKVRGLLCFHCNTTLGKFNDDPKLFERAAGYLRSQD